MGNLSEKTKPQPDYSGRGFVFDNALLLKGAFTFWTFLPNYQQPILKPV
jgi:hypothetical protein